MNTIVALDSKPAAITAPAPRTSEPAILPAARAADQMAQHLEASFKRSGSLDVVSRAHVEDAVRSLDRMFALEAYRFAYFHEDPLEFEEYAAIGSELSEEQSEAIVALFSDPTMSVVSSFLNMDDQALAESLEFGLTAIAWEGEARSTRELLIDPAGGRLPVAYLTHAFKRAATRLQGLLEHRAGLTRSQAQCAAQEIRRSVAIEAARAGTLAGERLETLASWVLTLEQIDATFITRLITRGQNLFLMSLLAVASGVPEADIRESAFDREKGGLHTACRRLGLSNVMADFMLDAILEGRELGRVRTAEDLAVFAPKMARWIEARAAAETAPEQVIEAALVLSDWLDWMPCEAIQAAQKTAEIIVFRPRA